MFTISGPRSDEKNAGDEYARQLDDIRHFSSQVAATSFG